MKELKRMSPERLAELIDSFSCVRIAVLGDFFLDKYLDVDPSLAETSLETGKTAHQVAAVRHSPGAAGTVVCNLAALGAGAIHAVGFTGDDGESYDLRKDLASLGCSTGHLDCEPGRMTPTYLKPRDRSDPSLAGEHNRYDTKNRTPTGAASQARIIRSLDALLPEVDAVIAMDQVDEEDCGVVTSAVVEALADRARGWPKVIFWADSRRRIRRFRNVIIKPNQFEAAGVECPRPGESVEVGRLCEAVAELRRTTKAPICVTRGAAGMLASDPEPTLISGVRLGGPVDPTGAGDSVTAAAVLALSAGASLPEAALVGNLVASLTVQQLATTGVARPGQLGSRLEMWLAQQQ
jgi:rfaE bifunctional protein kinase chain/domain